MGGAPPGAGACGHIVARDDAHLHATAMFAPQPARDGLMVLYAYDIELSRAVRASAESLIPRMRLQFWQDTVAEAAAGAPPRAHEVAAPLAALIAATPVLAEHLAAMADGAAAELDRPFDRPGFEAWAARRFGARTAAAAAILGEDLGPVTADQAGRVLGTDLALRSARAMAAAGGPCLVPGPAGPDLAALARGETTDALTATARDLAQAGLDDLAALRRQRRGRGAVAAFLPLARAGRVLGAVARAPVLGQIDRVERPFDGLRLALRALTGRW